MRTAPEVSPTLLIATGTTLLWKGFTRKQLLWILEAYIQRIQTNSVLIIALAEVHSSLPLLRHGRISRASCEMEKDRHERIRNAVANGSLTEIDLLTDKRCLCCQLAGRRLVRISRPALGPVPRMAGE